jgi:Restriction endonuclease BglII
LECLALLDKLAEKGFEIQFESHAAAILEKDFPEALTDLEQALGTLTIPITEIIGSGGGETKGTQRMRRAFNNVGWHKFIFEIRKIINGTEREAISHEIDHVKDFGKYKLALEIEWNNKEGLFWGESWMAPGLHTRLARLNCMGKTQMMSGTSKDSKLRTPGFTISKPRRTHMFRNYYRCPYDGAAWIDEWSCMCNDRCPTCRAEIEPYDSEDIWVLS